MRAVNHSGADVTFSTEMRLFRIFLTSRKTEASARSHWRRHCWSKWSFAFFSWLSVRSASRELLLFVLFSYALLRLTAAEAFWHPVFYSVEWSQSVHSWRTPDFWSQNGAFLLMQLWQQFAVEHLCCWWLKSAQNEGMCVARQGSKADRTSR